MSRVWRLVAQALSCLAVLAVSSAANAQKVSCDKTMLATLGGTLRMSWTGEIVDPMADCIAAEFDKAKATVRDVLLSLESDGGTVKEAERAIAVLKNIRQTHRIDTAAHQTRPYNSAGPSGSLRRD